MTSRDVSSANFWEQAYQDGRDGWDLGGPTPVFLRLLQSGRLAPGRLLVLGAGRGYDARAFARAGFAVTAVDFADDAIQAMRALAEPDAPLEVLQADLFTLPGTLDEAFDYVLEYTCFCAIDPARRPEYADTVTRLLRPGGTYVDLAYPLREREGGPPFSVSVAEVLALFEARGFRLVSRERPADSVPHRRGHEELLILEKAGPPSHLST